MGVCNNGRAVFSASVGSSSAFNFYLLDSNSVLQEIYMGAVANVLLNSAGDFAFVGLNARDADTNFLYYDATSHLTPEPSSLLLTIGGLASATVMYGAGWLSASREA